MMLLHIFILASAIGVGSQASCPAAFLRFSTNPSRCLAPKCEFLQRGIQSASDRDDILSQHNLLRSKMATGQEKGFPTAADMMEMVWDTQLEEVAQKWAEQCLFEHDCAECRQVENFPVGQNIAYEDWTCTGLCTGIDKPNWKKIIKDFYDEVVYFSPSGVSSFHFGEKYGHFTQVVWAKTWRIGCGYVRYMNGRAYRQLYVCNYGPAGNFNSEPMYQAGNICSKCPKNSCCGSQCKNGPFHNGLCKMLNLNEAPSYAPDPGAYIFNCDFTDGNRACAFAVNGTNNWQLKKTLSGNYVSSELKGGQSSSLQFRSVVRPSGSDFCLEIVYRKGPTLAGKTSSSDVSVQFKPRRMNHFGMKLDMDYPSFSTYRLTITMKDKFRFSVDVRVPSAASPQFLEISSIVVYNGKCRKS